MLAAVKANCSSGLRVQKKNPKKNVKRKDRVEDVRDKVTE